jgi:hypothetical protein
MFIRQGSHFIEQTKPVSCCRRPRITTLYDAIITNKHVTRRFDSFEGSEGLCEERRMGSLHCCVGNAGVRGEGKERKMINFLRK